MTCREFGSMAVELARGRGVTEEIAAEAAAHTAECARCAARLAGERSVTEALAELAASAKEREAGPRVEAALHEAFARRENAPQVRPVRRAYWGRWAAAAAVAAAVVGISAWLRVTPVVEAPAVSQYVPQAAAALPQQVAPAAAVPQKLARALPAKARVRRPAAPKREVATRYYPLRYTGGDVEEIRGPVLRVQVPRTTLVSFGLPIDHDRATEPVQADLALDETGMARAIRFVRLE